MSCGRDVMGFPEGAVPLSLGLPVVSWAFLGLMEL